MLKNIIVTFLFAIGLTFILVTPTPTRAQMMGPGMGLDVTVAEPSGGHAQDLDEVVADFLVTYNAEKVQDLDCTKIADTDFERLGDAVMERIHPGAQHERMDEMMGGEGSESLKLAHIRMGQNYLGCNTGKGGGWNMMGGGMMGGMVNMMGGRAVPWLGSSRGVEGWQGSSEWWQVQSALTTVIYLLAIGLLIILIRYFWKKGNKA